MEEEKQDIYDNFFSKKLDDFFDTNESLVVNQDKDIVENEFVITDYGRCKTFFYVFLQYKARYKDIIDAEQILEQITESITKQTDFRLKIDDKYSVLISPFSFIKTDQSKDGITTIEKYELIADLSKIGDVEMNNILSVFEYNYKMENKLADIMLHKEEFDKIKLYNFIVKNEAPYQRAHNYLIKAKKICSLKNELTNGNVTDFNTTPEYLPLIPMSYYLLLFYVKLLYCNKKKKYYPTWI